MEKNTTTVRPIYEIANEISKDWAKVNYAAEPYLEAMYCLKDKDSNYGLDSATSIVCYFLCNANTWKGETARRIKSELKAMVGIK